MYFSVSQVGARALRPPPLSRGLLRRHECWRVELRPHVFGEAFRSIRCRKGVDGQRSRSDENRDRRRFSDVPPEAWQATGRRSDERIDIPGNLNDS